MPQKEERVEHNRFGQSDRQNSVNDNRRKRARISTDRGRHSQTRKTDPDSDAHRGETDVNASSHFCKYW